MDSSTHIVQYLSAKTRWPLQKAEKVFDTLTDIIIKELSSGNDLQLADFGQLEVKTLPNRKTVFFKSSFYSNIIKDLSYLEDAIKTQLKDDGQDLSKGFTTEIFTHLKQLLIKEGKIDFGLLGTFQKREGADQKIIFIPSSFLRKELNQGMPDQPQTAEDQQPSGHFSRGAVETLRDDLEKKTATPEVSNTVVPEVFNDVEPEVFNDDYSKPDVSSDDQSKPDVSNVVIPNNKRKIPDKNTQKRGKTYFFVGDTLKLVIDVLLILIALAGLTFVAYKCFPEFFEQYQFVRDLKSALFSI